MFMDKKFLKDIFQWDVENWSRCLKFWEKYLPSDLKGLKVLEIGCGNGGLSLYFALRGANVICSDLQYPEKAEYFHKNYGLKDNIHYASINALDIPYNDYFDIVCFKSVMDGVSRDGNDEYKNLMVKEIYKSLKEGGYLFFAENLSGCLIHRIARRLFVRWGKSWNYLKMSELGGLFNNFAGFQYITYGFFGALGRNESQRMILGKLDRILIKIIPSRWHYIIFGVAKK